MLTARRMWFVVFLVAAVAVALRLPTLDAPPAPDEAGFLMVGGQWHASGRSLYGGDWVDRPPLLIALFGLAQILGGTVALRLFGCLAALGVVVLAALLGRTVAGRGRENLTAVWAALAGLAFVTTPLLGAPEVDGELLAAPMVLAGILAFLVARSGSGPWQGHALLAVS